MKRAVVIALALVAGCSAPRPPDPAGPTTGYGDDPLVLVLTSPADPRPLVLSSGRASVWIGRDGSGSGQKAFVWERDGSPLLETTSPIELKVLFDGVVQSPSERDYRQSLDLRTGAVRTEWKSEAVSVVVDCAVGLDRDRVVCDATVTAVREGDLRVVWGQVATPLTLLGPQAPRVEARVVPGSVVNARHIVGCGPSALSQSHASIEIEGPVEDRQAVNSMVHFVCGGAGDGLGPFGTTHTRYDGRVFWDQDAWVFPVVALLAPQRARAIVAFRTGERFEAARAAAAAEFPSVTGAARFPWESDSGGREAARPDNRDEIHVSGAVARMSHLAAELGLLDDGTAKNIVGAVARYFLARASPAAGGKLGLMGVRSPDEYQIADNDLYTNALAEWCLRTARPGESWVGRFRRPRDTQTFLTYDDDPLMGYQQAAALLALWPLQDPVCETEARPMLARFVGKATPNGPSMTSSVESLLLARFGDPDRAYDEWRAGVRRATSRPFMMFSESPKKAEAYFVTGAAGFLDSVLYGFLGLRFDPSEPQGVRWKSKLRHGWVSCTPRLPSAWSKITVRGMTLNGRRYDVVASRSSVTVTPVPGPPPK
ncbi:MAG: hypothetical protein JST30_08255 [Armatimonadetes bacterium]|nr:hypothetical protein [Armatimonadota bacterium]